MSPHPVSTGDATTPGIDVEEHEGVLLARLRTGPHGLLTTPVADALTALVVRAERDDGVRAVVLTGTHSDRFVAHADVGWLAAGAAASGATSRGALALADRAVRAVARLVGRPRAARLLQRSPLAGLAELDRFHDTLLRMNTCGAVFVAALNGSALGGGLEIALACDLRLLAEGDHVVGQPEVLLGFPPGGGGTQRLARLLGPHRALQLVLDGGGVGPPEALALGLVDEVVAPAELIGSALARAEHLGRRDKVAVAACKRAVYVGGSQSLSAGLERERVEFLSALSGRHAQAVAAAYQGDLATAGDPPAYVPGAYATAVRAGSFPTAVTSRR